MCTYNNYFIFQIVTITVVYVHMYNANETVYHKIEYEAAS